MVWGPIIAGGLGLLGGILGNKDSGKQQNVTTTQEIPEWVKQATQWNIDRGQAIANQPYTPYPGDRLAGFNPMQQNAFATADQYGQMGLGALGHGYNALTDTTGANLMGNAYGGLMNFNAMGNGMGMGMGTPMSNAMFADPRSAGQAAQGQASLADRGAIRDVNGGSFLDLNRSDYMNPYTQNVSDNVMSDFNRLGQQQVQQQGAAANAAGAFGGSRHGVADATLLSENNRNYGQLSNQLWNQAYDNASGLMGQDLNRGFQADLSNQGMDWNTQNLNANLGSQMSMFNTGQTNSQNQFNAGQANQVGMYNAGLGTQNNQFNAGNQLQNQQFGQGLGLQAQGLNLQALMGAGNLGQGIANFGLDQGRALTDYGISGLGAQQMAGDRQQAQQQLGNDWDYSQFLEARDWMANRAQYGINPLQGQDMGMNTTQPYFGPSNLQAGLGGAMMGLAAYNQWNGGGGMQGTVPGQAGQYGPNYGYMG